MTKRILSTILAVILLISATACGDSQENKEQSETKVESQEERDFSDKLGDEDGEVKWVRGHSGNFMMTMARHNGYLEEYGLTVEEMPMQTTDESFAAVKGGQVNVVSNAGTATPLQRIATGDDLIIFGGHMVEGFVKMIGLKDSEHDWSDGVESIIGKTVAGSPRAYQYTGPLLEMGYDPHEDINWVNLTDGNAMAAVLSGEVDAASVGTEFAHTINTNPNVEVIVDSAEIMPAYSCCRMESDSNFVFGKPNTTKALIKALLRGMRDFEKDTELAIELLAEELDADYEFVEAYAKDSGYKIHPDPLYNTCVKAWTYLDMLGFLDDNAQNMDLRDYIVVDMYKEALDEVIEEVGDEDPEYWQGVVDYFEENNSMYYDEEEQDTWIEDFKTTVEENRAKNLENK